MYYITIMINNHFQKSRGQIIIIYKFSKDSDYVAAMYRAHNSIGQALFYTAITIIIGFSILALSNFIPSIYFGLLTKQNKTYFTMKIPADYYFSNGTETKYLF